jgi:hypothetical protein
MTPGLVIAGLRGVAIRTASWVAAPLRASQ